MSIALRFLHGSLAAALLLSPSSPIVGAAPRPQNPKEKSGGPALSLFAGNLTQALARAKERNVPIVAIALLDEERENVTSRVELLASPEIAALSVRCVLFFSNVSAHKPREVVDTIDGKKRTRSVCSAYGTPTCKEHQQHWDDIYNQFNEDGELRCPQVLVLTPDGKLAERITPGHSPEIAAIVAAAAKAQTALGRGLDDAALAQVKDAIVRATRAEIAAKHGTAWRALAEVLALSPDGERGAAAKEGQKRAVAGFAVQRDEAVAKLAVGNGLEGYLALEELARDWVGCEQALELARTMKRAEKEPALKEALTKKKREDEATALWDEAEAARSAKQPKERERKIKLLLKKYPGTAAWERAAKAHPEWVGEKPAQE